MITPMALRAARDQQGLLSLLSQLGYDTSRARPYDLSAVGLSGEGLRIRGAQTKGPGVLVGEVEALPSTLKTVGRRMLDGFHDQPLAFLGTRGVGGWSEVAVVRPRLVKGGGGAVTVTRLVFRPQTPTAHDVEVVGRLGWDPGRSDVDNQRQIDQALDVERVTRRFFTGLRDHFDELAAAVTKVAGETPAVHAAVERGQGAQRVALRIVTQTLFTYFLQRKGLMEQDPQWLSSRFRAQRHQGGGFYGAVMEPLFYDTFAVPDAARDAAHPWPSLPFLNGGLFERRYGANTLPLDDALFDVEDGLLGFLDRWSFTVAEERADEVEVAVDPEMLGKVFENLVAEDQREVDGTVYTPRPVVQFMCREALVPYLQRTVVLSEADVRLLIDGDTPFEALADRIGGARASEAAAAVDAALAALRVIDPAVGSGAFPLGMLSEIVRLRRAAAIALGDGAPSPGRLHEWKLHAIEETLFGVDKEPIAIELCRLRLWLALLVDVPSGESPEPLPNLEYRMLVAYSLSDFVGGVEVQNTRDGVASFDTELFDGRELGALRTTYLRTADPAAKQQLREQIASRENAHLEAIFTQGREQARGAKDEAAARTGLDALAQQFAGGDRVFPAFMPAFHAPDVAARGGWDIAIMNPPYVGHKEVIQRLDAVQVADLKRHFGEVSDLMVHFAGRALQLVRPNGGVMSMIFNDSVFTNSDAQDLRARLIGGPQDEVTTHVAARTKCFEGVAVNGGVVVASRGSQHDPKIRWVENHKRPTTDLLAAGRIADPARSFTPIGQSELWEVESEHWMRLPHRPMFRPSRPALAALRAFERCVGWRDGWSRASGPTGQPSWALLSNTRALAAWRESARRDGWYDQLRPGTDFVLLGLVAEGGQGLATADDRRFLAVLDGTPEAERVRIRQLELRDLAMLVPEAAAVLRAAEASGASTEEALVVVGQRWTAKELGWPKAGTIRVAEPTHVRRTALTEVEVREGLHGETHWVPFEKGDSSADGGGGAKWRRDNPFVIDWSQESVGVLRDRARHGPRRPYFRNETLWGRGGVGFNAIASFLRGRLVPEGGIHGHGSPILASTVEWLTPHALLALFNSPVFDFVLRTFVCSRMNVMVGDLRRLPVPVLDAEATAVLDDLGRRAVAAKERIDAGDEDDELGTIEADLDVLTRDLYSIRREDELWVVR